VQEQKNEMTVYGLNPLTDPRWPVFVTQHPDASAFHSREWLDAIRRTYGYEPVAFTTSSGEALSNAMVFCEVRSWLTGRRLVSLPFSDHCQPLAAGRELSAILQYLTRERHARRQKYVEIRSVGKNACCDAETSFVKSNAFCFHTIDLRPELKTIYSGFHDSCIRRKIKRAEKEKLVYETGRSEELLKKFRHLLLLTRRRHQLPPQPATWFQNIVECLGDAVTIHMASKDTTPVASILTLKYKNSLVYKYGCSDAGFSNLGGTPLLFWKAIQHAKETGVEFFDLGRSDCDEPGLIAFKEHLGAISSELVYYRDPPPLPKRLTLQSSASVSSLARKALVSLPDPLLAGVGQLLYRHIG
jgi:lipid II:glycine glycyltransferase (peptidoglycan interpeptide bridge formation enzyme)